MKTLVTLALALALPVAAHAETGRLIDLAVTGTMQMQGVNMPIPQMVREVCMPAKQLDPRNLSRDSHRCTVSNYQAAGDTVSFHLTCQGAGVTNGDGVFHHHADGGMDGKMHTVSDMHGHSMTMDANYLGTPKGSCDYQPPKS